MIPLFCSVFAAFLAVDGGDDESVFRDLLPPYGPTKIIWLLEQDPRVKAELKITKEQAAGIRAVTMKWGAKHDKDDGIKFKMKGPDKEKHPKIRAMDAAAAEELFGMLSPTLSAGQIKRLRQLMAQQWGSTLFAYPENRALLKMGDQQAAQIRALYKKLRDDSARQALDGKISREEYEKRDRTFMRGVPPAVRATLTAEQQKVLNDLLGEPFDWWAK